MSLESFKSFVKQRPFLVDSVRKKEQTWQDFYNIYELYGENSSVWDKYKAKETDSKTISLKDFFSQFKNIDTNEIQKSISSIQKGISYVEGLISKKEPTIKESLYKPRPIHKHFDD